MARYVLVVACVLLALTGGGCEQTDIADAGDSARIAVATSAVPVIVAARELAEPAAVSGVPEPRSSSRRDELAAELIVRWEVTSASTYTRRYSGVVYPGGTSGPTWAIGFDGGMQTRGYIADVWAEHIAVERLETTSGVVGSEAKRRIAEWRDVVTSYDYAYDVFLRRTVPDYTLAARRAFGPSFDKLPDGAHAALVSLVYNRGGAMSGDRRREMRTIRDECVPAADAHCIARELIAMCRIWPDVPGLCNRRKDEARVAKEFQ
jgi:hypothetical protein